MVCHHIKRLILHFLKSIFKFCNLKKSKTCKVQTYLQKNTNTINSYKFSYVGKYQPARLQHGDAIALCMWVVNRSSSAHPRPKHGNLHQNTSKYEAFLSILFYCHPNLATCSSRSCENI